MNAKSPHLPVNLKGQEGRAEIILTPHPQSLPMNLKGQEGRRAIILTPHPQSFSPLRGEGRNRRTCRGTSGVQGDKARIFGGILPSVPFHEPQGTRREGGEHSHPSPSIPLPVEGRGKSPSADLGKFGVHGPDARPLLEVEAPHEPGGPSPHPGPLPSHPMGAERESAFAKATADR